MKSLHLTEEIRKVSLSMFRKSFFGVYHGSISARVTTNSFLINRKEAIFDEVTDESLIVLDVLKRDYRWSSASLDSEIHEQIYQDIPQAKYISYTMPPYATAYALQHTKLKPRDYFGVQKLGDIEVYDPRAFHDWYDRAPYEISSYFRKNTSSMMLIKGYGLFAYDRDIAEMAKKIAILENSARLLILNNSA